MNRVKLTVTDRVLNLLTILRPSGNTVTEDFLVGLPYYFTMKRFPVFERAALLTEGVTHTALAVENFIQLMTNADLSAEELAELETVPLDQWVEFLNSRHVKKHVVDTTSIVEALQILKSQNKRL
jgi:hypothetical protein